MRLLQGSSCNQSINTPLLNRIRVEGEDSGEDLERRAGCLRSECTGWENIKATNNTVADGQCCVEKRGEADGDNRFKAGALHWAPCHRCSCPRHQCSRLEKPQGGEQFGGRGWSEKDKRRFNISRTCKKTLPC